MLVRLDGQGRVSRVATEEDMALLSELLSKQGSQDCSSDSRCAAPEGLSTAITRKPGGPCCHCNVTGAIFFLPILMNMSTDDLWKAFAWPFRCLFFV